MQLLILLAALYGPYEAEIIRIKDGDTIDAIINTWPGQRTAATLRLNIADTPEKNSSQKCERELAKKATTFTTNFLKNSKVTIEIYKTDNFGRYLANIKSNDKDLATELLNAGLARVYKPNDHTKWCNDE